MSEVIDKYSGADLRTSDSSEDEFDKPDEITRPRKADTESILALLKDPKFSSKTDSKSNQIGKSDGIFALGSTDLLGETAPRKRREKQREKSSDGFSGYDIQEMLQIGNSKPGNVSNAKFIDGLENGTPNNGKTAISELNGKDEIIPLFIQSSNDGGPRRSRGVINSSTQPHTKASEPSKTKEDRTLDKQGLKKTNSLLDLLDKVISKKPIESKQDSPAKDLNKKSSILDILDMKFPTEVKKSLGAADSISSIALLSGTDDEIDEPITKTTAKVDIKNSRSKEILPSSKSKEKLSRQDHDNQVKTLKEELSNATKNFEIALEIEKRHRDQLELENEGLLTKMQKLEEDHHREIEELKSLHQHEKTAMVSTAEATDKLNGIVNQMQNSAQMISRLQSQLDETNDESLRARENAVEVKEIHLSRMQEELRIESKTLREERNRVESYLLELQESIKVSAAKEAQALEAIERERAKLKLETERFERERDDWKFTFNQQKTAYSLEVENWNNQKQASLIEINKERKEISIIKASLVANEKNSVVRDLEFQQRIKAEREQFDVEYRMFESERSEFLQKLKVLHQDEAFIKTERLKLEEKHREVETMSKIFEKDKNELEFTYSSISNMRDDAVTERKKTEKLHDEIKELKKELEETRASCHIEVEKLKDAKSEFIRQRVEKSKQKLLVTPALNEVSVLDKIVSTNIVPAESNDRKMRSKFRIDPKDERYRHSEPRATVWSKEERALAAQLEKALDRQVQKFKRNNADRIFARQERLLVNAR